MVYRVELRPSARRELLKLPRHDQIRLVRAMDGLVEVPHPNGQTVRVKTTVQEQWHTAQPKGVKKLTGAEDLYRIRVGDYGVVYQIKDDRLIVLVVRIGHRKDVYR